MLRKILGLFCYCLTVLALSGLAMSCGGGGGGSSSGYSGTPTYSLSGKVSGAVVQGVTISLSGAGVASTTTNTSGVYSFGGLSNGSYTVTAARASYAFSPASQVVPVNSANAVAPDFVSANAYSISGTVVVGGIGGTSEGVTMTLIGPILSSPVTTLTDSIGNYLFISVVSNGTYTVTPSQSSSRMVCTGGLNPSPRLVTETTTFTPTEQSITINNADLPGVNFSGIFNRWTGVCPL